MIKKILVIFLSIFVFSSIGLITSNNYSYKAYSNESDDFIPSPSPVMAEQFTGAWCGWCPYVAGALELVHLTKYKNEDFMYLAYHDNDTMANSETEERQKLYKITGFPTIVFGGTNKISGVDSTDFVALSQGYVNIIDQMISAKHYIADVSIEGSFERKEFNLKILPKEDLRKRNINIVAVIYEDYVNAEGSNGECFHRFVVRNMPYGSSGRTGALKLKEGQIWSETRKFVLASKSKELLGIVVYLQDMDTKAIVGSGLYQFSDKPEAMFYWGNKPEPQAINVNTCQNDLIFSVKDAKDLKEIFIKIKPNNEYFELVSAKISPKIGENNGTISVDIGMNEIKCTFKEGINGNSELIYMKVFFKKTTDKLKLQIRKFASTDIENNQLPFQLLDLNNLSYLKVTTNPYDIDGNLSVNSSDLTVLINCFGATKKDKDFNRKCDFNKDSRIDINDFMELQSKIED